jgi:hypothetical protein
MKLHDVDGPALSADQRAMIGGTEGSIVRTRLVLKTSWPHATSP